MDLNLNKDELYFQEGYSNGKKTGEREGFADGFATGVKQGIDLFSELGRIDIIADGVLKSPDSSAKSRKAADTLKNLVCAIMALEDKSPSESFMAQVEKIRLKFRILTSLSAGTDLGSSERKTEALDF